MALVANGNAVKTMKLGDVVNRTVRFLYLDIQRAVEGLGRQTEDMRTIALQQLFHRTKIVLLQLLIICRWIGEPEVVQFMQQIEALQRRISTTNNGFNADMDRLYFLHAGLYPLRSHAYEIRAAKDILYHRSFSQLLPQSIFLRDSSHPSLSSPSYIENKEVILQDMNIFLQAKMYLTDALPSELAVDYRIEEGLLKLTSASFFTLILTLSDLHENAHWHVVGVDLEVQHHPIEACLFSASRYDTSSTEERLLTTLRDLASRENTSLVNILSICRCIELYVLYTALCIWSSLN